MSDGLVHAPKYLRLSEAVRVTTGCEKRRPSSAVMTDPLLVSCPLCRSYAAKYSEDLGDMALVASDGEGLSERERREYERGAEELYDRATAFGVPFDAHAASLVSAT